MADSRRDLISVLCPSVSQPFLPRNIEMQLYRYPCCLLGVSKIEESLVICTHYRHQVEVDLLDIRAQCLQLTGETSSATSFISTLRSVRPKTVNPNHHVVSDLSVVEAVVCAKIGGVLLQ
jgi:hypothetical protein